MNELIDIFKNNFEWLFGGIGTTVLVALVGYFLKKNKELQINQNQKSSGDNSKNVQIGQIKNDKN